jgi:hypothetical protein
MKVYSPGIRKSWWAEIAICYALNGAGIKLLVGTRYCTLVQTDPEAHTASCTMGPRSFFRWVNRPGRVVDYLPPSNAEVTERVE